MPPREIAMMQTCNRFLSPEPLVQIMVSEDVRDSLEILADASQITIERLLKCVSVAMLKAAALGGRPDVQGEIYFDIADQRQ